MKILLASVLVLVFAIPAQACHKRGCGGGCGQQTVKVKMKWRGHRRAAACAPAPTMCGQMPTYGPAPIYGPMPTPQQVQQAIPVAPAKGYPS